MPDPKKQLHITLTEPVIFLRSSDPSGRREPDPNDPPALVRGILTLDVTKPIDISSIELELTGLSAFTHPEGVPPRHISDVPEKHIIYSSTVTVFRANQVPRGKRPASVGPGLSAAISHEADHTVTAISRAPSSPRSRFERRSAIALNRDLRLDPTPPYTPLAQPPTPRVGTNGESPAQTLEEFRQTLRGNLEEEVYRNTLCDQLLSSPSNLHSIAPYLTNSAAHSDTSIDSNEHPHQENDGIVRTSPPFTGDLSSRNNIEELPSTLQHRDPSPNGFSRSYSPENTRLSQTYARRSSDDSSNIPTGRSRFRLSLGSVLDAVMEVTSKASSRSRDVTGSDETERGRTRVRVIDGERNTEGNQGVGGIAGIGNSSRPIANASHPTTHMEHREHHLLGLGRILGLQRDHEKEKDVRQKSKERGEGWKEFQPGTYSYPISFLLPPNLPPTFSVPRGSLTYTIKGVAHRRGTFTSKLSCQVPLLVVAAPTVGSGEGGGSGDLGPLLFQKQWEEKLAYSFTLSSRLFLLGSQRHLEAATSTGASIESLVGAEARAEAAYGTAILDLTLLPLEKVKIWKLSVLIDQHTGYFDGRRKLLVDEDIKRVKLLEVQDICSEEEMDLVDEEEPTTKEKHKKHNLTPIPLLPTPISPHRSPLLRYIPPSADPSILAGPGPYTLSTTIGLPDCNDPIHDGLQFTVKQKSSVVKVQHFLRLVVRVEKIGDEGTNDHKEGDKKRMLDITVQAPITILSCRCVPEYQTLPRYSQATEDCLPNRAACPCPPNGITRSVEHGLDHDVGNQHAHAFTPTRSSSFENEDGVGYLHHRSDESSRSSSRTHLNPLHSPSSTHEAGWSPVHTHIHSHGQQLYSHSRSHSVSNVRTHSLVSPVSTPHSSRPPSPLARYERLVSGLESEAGEAPPSYESIASRR